MRLVRAQELIGRAVVSIDRGHELAEIRDVVYDGTTNALVGFTLSGRDALHRRQPEVLPAGNVRAIGPDAVMVDDSSAIALREAAGNLSTDDGPDSIAAPSPDRENELVGDEVDERDALTDRASVSPVVGNRVLTADGTEHGEVVAVILDIDGPPRAVGYELKVPDDVDNCFVPISAQLAVSGENLVLREGATDLMCPDLEGLAGNLQPADTD